MEKKSRNAVRVILDVLVVLLLVFAVFVSVVVLSSKSTGSGSFFGFTVSSVQSDSMKPVFEKGDLIIGKNADNNTEYKVGDIVTYEALINGSRTLNTHRIKEIAKIGGTVCYFTKGDNSPEIDEDYIVAEQIYASYSGTRLKGVGYAFDFLRSSNGFFFCLLLPMIFIFIFEIIAFINNLVKYNKEKVLLAKENAVLDITEEQKKQIAEEYMASHSDDEKTKKF